MSKFNLTGQLQLQQPRNLQSTLKKIQDYFGNIGANVNVRVNTRQIKEASSAIGLVNTEAIAATKSTGELGKTLGIAARRFGAISIATGTFLSLVRSIKNSVSEAIEFDRELNKITQATGATGKAIDSIRDKVFELSTSLGVSSKELVVAARTLAQAGIAAEKAAGALKILSEADLAATFGSIEDNAEGMIAILAQFGKEATKNGKEVEFLARSFDAINSVSKAFAVESQDIIAAVRKTGGSFEAAGGNLNELISLFTSVRATTRESADTIATAFRTIFTRIQRTDTIDALRDLGIELQDTKGKFVGPLKAIENLAVGLSVLDKRDYRFTQIIEELGGIRQIGKVIPLLKEFAVTDQALNVALNSTGSTAQDAATAQQALAVQIKKVKEEFQSLIQKFVNGNFFKDFAYGALELARAIIEISKALLPLTNLLAAFAAVKIGAGLKNAFTSFAGFGGSQKKNKGGVIHKFATGGMVPGSGNRDTVPAMLTPGEFVIRKSSVSKLGTQNLQKLNRGGNVRTSDLKNLPQDVQGATSLRKKISAYPKKWNDVDETYLDYKIEEFDPSKSRDPGLRRDYANGKKFGNGKLKGDAFEAMVGKYYGLQPTGNNDYLDFKYGEAKSDASYGKVLTGNRYLSLLSKTLNSRNAYISKLTPNKDIFAPSDKEITLYVDKLRNANKDQVDAIFGKAKKYTMGGPIKDETTVGALVLAGSDFLGKGTLPLDVTRNEVIEKAKGEGKNYDSLQELPEKKVYNYVRAGIKENQVLTDIYANIEEGLRQAVEASSLGLSKAGLGQIKIPNSAVSNLIQSIGTDSIGNVFEAMIKGVKDPNFTDNKKTAGFDFRGPLGPIDDSQLFSPDTKNIFYREAKGTKKSAEGSEIKNKIINTLIEQASGNLSSAMTDIDTTPKNTSDFPSVMTQRALAAKLAGKSHNSMTNAEIKKYSGSSIQNIMAIKGYDLEVISGAGKPLEYSIKKREKFATGGYSKGTDTVPAMLTPGEFVVNKSTAQKVGYGRLQRLNKTGDPQYLAKGGIVGGDGTAEDLISQDKLERAVQKALDKISLKSSGNSGSLNGDGDSNDIVRALEKAGLSDAAQSVSASGFENRVNTAKNAAQGIFEPKRDAKGRTGDKATDAAEALGLSKQEFQRGNAPQLSKADMDALGKHITDLNKTVQQDVKVQTEAVKETKANTATVKAVKVNTGDTSIPGAPGDKPDEKTGRSTDLLAQKFLFLSTGLIAAGTQLGVFSDATTEAAARALAFGASVYGIGSTIIDSVGSKFGPTLSKASGSLASFGSKALPSVSKGLVGLGNKFPNATASLNKSIGGAAGAANILQGALIGLAGGLAIVEYVATQIEQKREKANAKADEAVKETRDKGTNNFAKIEKSLLEASGAQTKAESARSRGTGGVLGGVAGGAAIGALIGSIVPVLGTGIGAGIGAAIGGIGGGLIGANSGVEDTSDPVVNAAKQSAMAQYTAAKATYDFAASLEYGRRQNLTGAEALNHMVKTSEQLDAAQQKAIKASGNAQFNRNNAAQKRNDTYYAAFRNGLSSMFGGNGEVYKPEMNDQEKKQAADEKAGLDELNRQRQESVNMLRSSTDQSISEYLASAKGVTTFADALKGSGAEKAIEAYRKGLIDVNTPQAQVEQIIKKQIETYNKQVESANENLHRQEALIAAKEAEVALILKTNAALNSLVQSSRDFQSSQNNVDRTLASLSGEAKSIPLSFANAFDNIGRVGNIKQFSDIANQAAAPLGPGGQDIANRVTSSADAIQKLRTGLNVKTLENVRKTNKLQGEGGRANAQKLITDIIGVDTFKGLGPELQNTLIETITSAGGSNQITQEVIDNILGQFEKGAQSQADVLKQTVELTSQYLAQYDQVSTAVISSMNKEVELRAGMVDIWQRGQDRLSQVFEGRQSEAVQEGIIRQKDASRTKAAQVALGPNLKNVKAGNVGSLSGALGNIINQTKNNSNILQNGNISPQQRGALDAKNKTLADSATKVTNELKRLADQSEKASDIMGQIGKERAKREFVKDQAENFVLGTQSDRATQMQTFQGANVVAQTGSFQSLPEEMRKSVSDLLKQIGDLEPGGAADTVRRNALKNDYMAAGLPPQLADALANDKSTSKEEKLIQDLRQINQEEMAAQNALLAAEQQNTQTVTQLLTSVNQLINVISQNFANNMPKQPMAKGFASGGSVFKPRGTDTIPAMLSDGEFVMRREAVDKYGVGFMSAINGGNAPAGFSNGGAVYRRRGGSVAGNGVNMFESLPQMLNAGLSGLTQSLTMLTQGLSNIRMTHEVNVNGQLNIGGLNTPAIAEAIKSSLGNYVVSVIKRELDNRGNQFRAG